MSKLKITGKELSAIGFPEGPVISIIMNGMKEIAMVYATNTCSERI